MLQKTTTEYSVDELINLINMQMSYIIEIFNARCTTRPLYSIIPENFISSLPAVTEELRGNEILIASLAKTIKPD